MPALFCTRRLVYSDSRLPANVTAIHPELAQVSDLPCNIRRAGGQSLVIGGSSLVVLEEKACNPLQSLSAQVVYRVDPPNATWRQFLRL